MNLSDRSKLFPERPWFAAWRINLDVRSVIENCTKWRGDELVRLSGKASELEALYEFLAAQGRLAEFFAAWQQIEDEHR